VHKLIPISWPQVQKLWTLEPNAHPLFGPQALRGWFCAPDFELVPLPLKMVGYLCRPYMTYDENSYRYRLNKFEIFAFFPLYTLAHPPSNVKQIMFHFLPVFENFVLVNTKLHRNFLMSMEIFHYKEKNK